MPEAGRAGNENTAKLASARNFLVVTMARLKPDVIGLMKQLE